jgi:DNA-binding NtrC family response regulator
MPRRRRRGLATWLTDSATPVFLLDARRLVLFFNHGCEQLTGWKAADVVGKTCDYGSEPEASQVESLTCALCPPPQTLGGEAAACPVRLVHRDGTVFDQTIHFLPLAGEDSELHILGFVLPPEARPAGIADNSITLHAELAALRSELRSRFQFDAVIARGPAMLKVMQQARLAVAGESSVHMRGDRGTGRAFLARAIHHYGPRRLQPFVPLDCELLTPFELKRTLQRLFETRFDDEPEHPSNLPGALYLNCVSSLPRDLQQFLFEAMVRQEERDLPGPRVFSADVRDLESAVEEEVLLPELYCRLTPLVIELPPLVERVDELPLLAQFFLEQINRDQDRQRGGFTPETLEQFRRYNWPGNVRELRLVVEEAHAAAAGSLVTVQDLPFRFRTGVDAQQVGPPQVPQPIDLARHLEQIERQEIERVLRETRRNKSRAAELLGLTRARFYRRLQQLGIDGGQEPSESE